MKEVILDVGKTRLKGFKKSDKELKQAIAKCAKNLEKDMNEYAMAMLLGSPHPWIDEKKKE